MGDRLAGVSGVGGKLRSKRVFAGASAAVGGLATATLLIAALSGGEAPAAAPTTAAPAPAASPSTVAATTLAGTLPPTLPITVPATTAAATTSPGTAPASVAPTVLPALGTPIDPPLDTHADEPVIELGRLAIPALGVDMAMYEGIRMPTLDRGPGHWPGSAMPGQPGNVVVGGHRTSKHAVFRHVDELVAGDEIVFTDPDGAQHVYVVSRTEVVEPSAVWIVDPTESPEATLFACHPPGSTRERIIVFSDFRETIPAPVA